VPFRAAVDAGIRAVMTAHVAYPALTGDDTPATLAPAIMTDLLRGELGFDGVVVTDALVMGAIAERYGCGEAAVMAMEAGVDVLLMPPDVEEAVRAVRNAVREGRVTEERIDRSLERIDDLHRWIGDYKDADRNHVDFPPEIEGAFGHDEPPDDNHRVGLQNGHEAAAENIARRAVTLLVDDGHVVPLSAAELADKDVAVFTLKDSERPINLVWFRSQLEATLPGVIEVEASERAKPDELAALAESAAAADVSIVAIFDDVAAWKGRSLPSEELLSAARLLLEAAPSAIVLAFTGPEIAVELPDGAALICCYDGSEPSQRAGVDALFGESPVSGRLPVDVPPRFKMGHGLMR
jgi:beta-N-acetylhexosaminidase